MPYNPSQGIDLSNGGGSAGDGDLALRIRLVSQQNPWMATRPDVLQSMAASPYDTSTLLASAGQLFGMQAGDSMRQMLERLDAPAQRAILNTLTPGQQASLNQLGYKAPASDANDGGWMGDLMKAASVPLGIVGKGISAIEGVPVIGNVVQDSLDTLTWVGNLPGRAYRTIRQLDSSGQMAGIFGALAGAAAVALAVPTGGASLAAMGTLTALGSLGLGAIAGASAASLAVTNPNDWMRAWGAAGDGERVFDAVARRRAQSILEDPRLTGLAQDIAAIPGFSLSQLAEEMAGQRDPSMGSQLKKLEGLAATLATPGTPEYEQATQTMYKALQDPRFQDAVQQLVRGKISIGRDLADQFLPSDSGLYRLISGATDALFTVAVDPTLMLAGANRLYQAQRYGLRVAEGGSMVEAFRKVAQLPAIKRSHDLVADAVQTGSVSKLVTTNKDFLPIFDDLLTYKELLRSYGRDFVENPFTRDDVVNYIAGQANLKPVMEGVGSITTNKIWVLRPVSAPRAAIREFRSAVRQFNYGMGDVRLERQLTKAAEKAGYELKDILPASTHAAVTDSGVIDMLWRINNPNPGAYGVGRMAARVPIAGRAVSKLADVMTSMTTMSIAGRAVHVTGREAPQQIRALAELGRYMGMPSWARQAWTDTILTSTATSARVQAVHGWLANMLRLTGAEGTPEGAELIKEYLERAKQIYGTGDEMLINGHMMHTGIFLGDQADMVVMPDLRELRDATTTTHIAKHVMGIVDHPVLQTALNKVWKPLVLLRIGFIPRAAGEEMAAFLMRGGIGSLTQEAGARFVGKRDAYVEAALKQTMGVGLTKDEQRLLEEGLYSILPNHVKPIYRMMARSGFNDQALQRLQDYGEWLRGWYRDGLSRFEPLDRAQLRVADWAKGYEGSRIGNALNYANAIFLGGEHSIRRMILGGVDDDLIHAGAEWFRQHSTTVMREASAINAGPVVPNLDQRNLRMSTEVDPKTGELRQVMYLTERGRRIRVAEDGALRHGIIEQIQRVTTDPVMGRVARDFLSRVKGGAQIDEATLDGMIRELWSINRKVDDVGLVTQNDAAVAARTILLELADTFRGEMWDSAMTRLARRPGTAPVANAIRAYHPAAQVPTKQSVLDALDNALDDPAAIELLGIDGYDRVQEVADALRNDTVIERLSQMDAHTRAFATQWLHGQVVGGEQSWYAQYLGRSFPPTRQIPTTAQQHVFAEFGGEAPRTTLRVKDVKAIESSIKQLRRQGDIDYTTQRLLEDMEAHIGAWRAGKREASGEALSNLSRELADIIGGANPLRVQAPGGWLYNGLGDAVPDMVAATRNGLLDPAMVPEGTSKSVRNLVLDDKGQIALEPTLRDANALLWEAPQLRAIPFDELRAMSRNPQILDENRDAVLELLAAPGDQTVLLRNQGLAEELQRIAAQRAGIATPDPVRYLIAPRNVAEGRADGLLRPVKGATDETVAWHYPTNVADRHLRVLTDEALDPMSEWARKYVNTAVDFTKRGNKYAMKARARISRTKDGTEISGPIVYRLENGKLVGVEPGSEVTASWGPTLRDDRGRPLTFGDPAYFDPAPTAASLAAQDVMWEAVGPALRDSFDHAHGNVVFRQKDLAIEGAVKGDIRQSPDIVAYQRSHVDDTKNLAADDLPSYAIHQVMTNRKIGGWDKMVAKGFDRVIGPAIDAVARRPMAFHAFAQRYIANKRALQWLVDPEVEAKALNLATGYAAGVAGVNFDVAAMERNARALAAADGVEGAAEWTRKQALAWLRGHSPAELSETVDRVARITRNGTDQVAKAGSVAAKQLGRHLPDFDKIRGALVDSSSMFDFVRAVEAEFAVPGALNSLEELTKGGRVADIYGTAGRPGSPLLRWIESQDGWEALVAAKANMAHLERTAGEAAATAAIADVVPFLDSHEFKTQFADYGKGMMPFWYAEENFLKRWARGLALEGPAVIRRAQLTYMGMKSAGVIRTDSSGRDWFVYPGSSLLADALDRALPGMSALPVGIRFQTPADQMLPGMNNRFGTPSFNPLVTVPLDVVGWMFPETLPAERAMLGDYASTRQIVDQLVPAHLRNLFYAATGDAESNPRYASAMNSAIAYLEAHDQGLPDDATPAQRDEFLRKVRDHARIIVVAQALAGFAAPGAPSITEKEPGDSATGLGMHDAADIFGSEYLRLVRMFGVEDGTAKFLEMNPQAGLEDVVNPEAYTVPINSSRSGAPIPPTEAALAFYNEHSDYFHQTPYAAPWLFPPAEGDERSQYAYDQLTVAGLRNRRSPEELLNAMKFKEASYPYFAMQDSYDAKIAVAQASGNTAEVKRLKDKKQSDLAIFRMAHPIFDEQLTSPDAGNRRRQVIEEMRYVVNDPDVPPSPQVEPLRRVMRLWDTYTSTLAVLADQGTSLARREIDQLKTDFGAQMNQLTKENPGIMSFWLSVLRPEAGLD